MRLTTDTPKNNLEMALNLFYVKDKEVWVRGYGTNGADISLFDLSRDLTRWNCPYVDLDISDDSFSMMMTEWLWEDVESFEHILALLYGQWENGNPICPVCGENKFKDLDADIWCDWQPDFCPNCGAKMDGGNDHVSD